jgi:TPR repeat protein
MYLRGYGVLVDYNQSMDWSMKAANNGNIDAMNLIAFMYLKGEGVTENIPTAIEWFTKAANQGNAEGQYWLGEIYRTDDVFKDLQKAVNWYQKAADNDYYSAKEEVEHLNAQGYYAKEDEQEGNID